jgi:hypothetical protein
MRPVNRAPRCSRNPSYADCAQRHLQLQRAYLDDAAPAGRFNLGHRYSAFACTTLPQWRVSPCLDPLRAFVHAVLFGAADHFLRWRAPVRHAAELQEAPRSHNHLAICRRKATTTASCSADSTVDRGSVGPVFRSAAEDCLFHFARVFGLTP